MLPRVQPNALLNYIRGVLAETDATTLSDRELLQRFAARRDEVAFKVIVRRHGPMVLRVCQRVLRGGEDAEDVFQATFLVLARKAASLNQYESVGTWLYEVAHRLGQGAFRKRLNQQTREARARARSVEDPLAEITGRELVAILDEELAKLPEQYRAPLLLCGLEGKSGDEAARDLGCSLSTLKRRLRQAREMLESRLSHRGFALSAALAALFLHNSAPAMVPTGLLVATARAATFFASGKRLTSGLVSARAVALAGGMTHGLLTGKMKVTLAALVLLGGLWAGTEDLVRPRGATNFPAGQTVSTPDSTRPLGEPATQQAWRQTLSAAPVAATVETNLATAPGQIRQFAFDGNPETYFASSGNAGSADHFTLVFDRPVSVKSVGVVTGRPHGGDLLDDGVLEVSPDGRTFTRLARFAEGRAGAQTMGRFLRAVRVRPGADLGHPLVVREFAVESEPPVAFFRFPVEFVVNVDEAPELREWAEKVARVCERAFPMINDELMSPGFMPKPVIPLELRNDRGRHLPDDEDTYAVATVIAGRIMASATYFQEHPEDVGALVVGTVFVVQRYRSGKNPGWLTTGIADYLRFYKFEPGSLRRIDPDREKYDSNSKAAAAFLGYLVGKYDRQLVRKLNQVMREGQYREEVFQTLTGKSLPELGEEWLASLRRGPGS